MFPLRTVHFPKNVMQNGEGRKDIESYAVQVLGKLCGPASAVALSERQISTFFSSCLQALSLPRKSDEKAWLPASRYFVNLAD